MKTYAQFREEFEMVSINRGLYGKLLKLARYAQD